MSITVLYFAALREGLGVGRETIEIPPEVETAGALRGWLVARGGRWQELLAPGRAVRIAVDQSMAGETTPIRNGSEVAFFPPVTGG